MSGATLRNMVCSQVGPTFQVDSPEPTFGMPKEGMKSDGTPETWYFNGFRWLPVETLCGDKDPTNLIKALQTGLINQGWKYGDDPHLDEITGVEFPNLDRK